MERIVVMGNASITPALRLAAECERMELVPAIDDLPPALKSMLAFMDRSPEEKAAQRKEWAQRAIEAKAARIAYRTEKPTGRAAQRRLRQLARTSP